MSRSTGGALRRPCDLKPRLFKLKHRLVLSLSLALATGPAQATPPPTQICVTPADAGRQACAWLSRAGAELAAGRAPEAAAAARRAESAAAGPDAQALVDAAQLLRADALARGRRLQEAAAIVATLSQRGSPDVRAAADLRWAELQLALGNPAQAYAGYQRLLPAAPLAGGHGAALWLRASEAAAGVGDRDSERSWLTRALQEATPGSDAALLAQARSELLVGEGGKGAIRWPALRRASAVADPEVAREGRALLARGLIQDGAFEEALGLLTELERSGASPRLGPALALTRARALDGLAAESRTPGGCRRVMGLARGRLPELARGAQRPEALLALASCSQTLGLEAYAARLRGAALASPGAAAASPSADATPPLVDGPARAAAAYAAGDFTAVRAMPEAMAWRTLAQAAETADRARAALAP